MFDLSFGFIGLFVDSLDVAAKFASAVRLDSFEPHVGHDVSSVPAYLSAQSPHSRGWRSYAMNFGMLVVLSNSAI
jgi:hypothetical protein